MKTSDAAETDTTTTRLVCQEGVWPSCAGRDGATACRQQTSPSRHPPTFNRHHRQSAFRGFSVFATPTSADRLTSTTVSRDSCDSAKSGDECARRYVVSSVVHEILFVSAGRPDSAWTVLPRQERPTPHPPRNQSRHL